MRPKRWRLSSARSDEAANRRQRRTTAQPTLYVGRFTVIIIIARCDAVLYFYFYFNFYFYVGVESLGLVLTAS